MTGTSLSCSYNELSALVRRFFEALTGGRGDYATAAKSVCWLELRGLDGIRQLVADKDNYQQEVRPLTDIVSSESTPCPVDLSGRGVFYDGFLVFDTAIGFAMHGAALVYHIDCEGDPRFVLPGLVLCSDAGLFATVCWTNEDGASMSVASITPGSKNPTVSFIADKTSDLSKKIMLAVSQDAAFTQQALLNTGIDLKTARVQSSITPKEFQERVDASLVNGISVNREDLSILSSIADRVLVESSDQSRKGAGD